MSSGRDHGIPVAIGPDAAALHRVSGACDLGFEIVSAARRSWNRAQFDAIVFSNGS
jgi:hypothetical protein